MSTDTAMAPVMMDSNRPTEYEQFLLFGDSITQFSNDQGLGFGFGAALQNGSFLVRLVDLLMCTFFWWQLFSYDGEGIRGHAEKFTDHFAAYVRRLDVINRGFR